MTTETSGDRANVEVKAAMERWCRDGGGEQPVCRQWWPACTGVIEQFLSKRRRETSPVKCNNNK